MNPRRKKDEPPKTALDQWEEFNEALHNLARALVEEVRQHRKAYALVYLGVVLAALAWTVAL